MPEVTPEIIDELETKVRQGDQVSVREFLRNVTRSEIPDRLILRLCQLARRVDYARKGIMLLRERIMDLPPQVKPDAREQAEYAACLLKLGGVGEARRLLLEVSPTRAPEVYKYLAFTYVHHWDYASAIPLLKSYLGCQQIVAYERLVGSLNLAAALIAVEDYREAQDMLIPLRSQAEREGHKLIAGNICELLAQTQIQLRQFARANDYIELSWQALSSAQPRYRLYLEKWKAVAGLLQDPADQKAMEDLRRVRAEAMVRSEWETIRDCDFHESIISCNKAMFLRLAFGTPYLPYRETMLRRSGGRIEIPESYVWGSSNAVLELETARIDGSSVVKNGLGLHRLLKALAFDFYAPASVPQIFIQIFENERFHPETSSPRVYELVRRLKAELASADIELPILPLKRAYRLDVENANCALLVRLNRKPSEGVLASIHSIFGKSEFRLRDLSERTHTAHTTLYREIKRLVENGDLVVLGSGKQSRYKAA